MLDKLLDIAMYVSIFFLSSIFAHFAAEKTVEWICSKVFWHITVDGKTFQVVNHLDVIQKYSEVRFWDVENQCWRHFVYNRLELFRIHMVKEDPQ